MFKRSSVNPIFVVFLIVACFDGLFFARAANLILNEDNKEGEVGTVRDLEFILVLGTPSFYRSQGKTLELDVGGCQVKVEKEPSANDKVKVSGSSGEAAKLYVRDENTGNAEEICPYVNIRVDAPEKFVKIKLDGYFAGSFLYVSDIRLTGVSTVSPSTSTELTTTLPSTAETSPSSSECLSNPVYIAIGAAAGLVGALVIVGIVALICCLVKKKRSAEKVVVKDVSVRNEKTKEITVGAGGEKSAFKDVTDNKSAYGTSVAPSPVTPSLL